jgi:hypothetical protein
MSGAGSSTDHYIQDAGECFTVWKFQEELENRGKALSIESEKCKLEFTNYCTTRKLLNKFNKSIYRKNILAISTLFITNLIELYPNRKMRIINTEVENRNKSLKGDFKILFDDNSFKSVSLKNYKGGYERIQLCSGTWNSLINKFFLKEAEGPGMFYNIEEGQEGKKYRGSNISIRNNNYKLLGYSAIIPLIERYDTINKTIKEKYVYNNSTLYWNDTVATSWKKDCTIYGCEASKIAKECLENLDSKVVLDKLLNMANLNNKEELLLIGNGKMLCSLFDKNYKTMLERVNSPNCNIKFINNNQTLTFNIFDKIGTIVSIDIPFTLQKNGAWFLEEEYRDKKYYHPKEGKELVYGERRPKKSKEIATSTNMWFDINKYLVNSNSVILNKEEDNSVILNKEEDKKKHLIKCLERKGELNRELEETEQEIKKLINSISNISNTELYELINSIN